MGCTRPSSSTLFTVLVTLLVAGVVGCGGRREAAPVEAPPTRTGAPCCLTERWEQPPPQIGDVPGDDPAPENALEPFERPSDGSGTL